MFGIDQKFQRELKFEFKMLLENLFGKKHLYMTYVKKNIAPDFTIPSPISKQRPYWDEFVQYKTSEEGVSRVIKNQRNAQQKTYCRRNMVGSLPRGMPKVVDYRQTGAQATNEMVTQDTRFYPGLTAVRT